MSSPRNPLAQTQLFSGLSDAEIEQVRAAASERTLETGQFLFFQGDPAEAVFVLQSGRVKLTQVTPEGQQIVLRMMGAWVSFAVISIVPGNTYPVTAEVVEDCSVLSWSQPAMADLVARFPQVAMNSLQILSQQVREFQDRYREMVTERVERRVARAVLRLAQQLGRKVETGILIDLTLSRQDLAEMTGTTLFSVSRILSSWEEQGLIESGRERIVVKFPHGLVRIAEDLPGPPAKK